MDMYKCGDCETEYTCADLDLYNECGCTCPECGSWSIIHYIMGEE